ncbi:MAG TPA: 16S rRNA (cytosine(1402)-N(4))-methyltransferase RsmH [Actinomycetota bacterium]|nr:16S rRNA (cytosine(1402)-N(4))-methyltransferase RsmH [Actinomycetota bacterium]
MSGGDHEPVMAAEVVELLAGRSPVVDMTVGAGGHAAALLEAGTAAVIGVDRDPEALTVARDRLGSFGDRVRLVHARFSEVDREEVGGDAGGVLFDLGVSSMQLDRAERGFSFRNDGPLDMRMDPGEGPSAADLVNGLSERELAEVIYRLGDERRSRRIAAAIVRRRPVTTTGELAGIVVSAVGRRPGGPHPARRTFQALRLAVNRELEELTAALPHAAGLLGPGGRVVVLSYHSLEDGTVKRAFRDDERLQVLTKRPLVPGADERERNPRARSAKLRAAERIGTAA